jgi:peptidoglycan lytic transglycosylase G
MNEAETRKILRQRGLGYWLRTIFTALFTIFMVIGVIAGGLFYFASQEFDRPGPLGQDTIITVRQGSGSSRIARQLESRGAIRNNVIFLSGLYFHKVNGKLRAGEYRFKKSASMNEIMQQLIAGRSILHRFTVPEGLTSLQIAERLKFDPVLIGKIDGVPGEGELLPETYVFQRGMTRMDLLAKMKSAQKKFLDKFWPGRMAELPVKTRKEVLILASIVEKETGVSAERPRVAGVFINRLKNNIRLQSDPTIIYGLVGGKGALGHPLRRSELNKKTPYNTYQIDGLPPTPIANPGKAAIQAVLNPLVTNEFYFVADGTGGHVFSKTLAEHEKNVASWRKIEKQRELKSKPSPSAPAVKPSGTKPR